MAILNSLIVNGSSRFLNKAWFNDVSIGGTLSTAAITAASLTSTGTLNVTGTSTLGTVTSGKITSSGRIYGTGFGTDGTMIVKPQSQNEFNFGGTSTSSTIYFGYRALDSKPIPTKFVFGGSGGSADLTAGSATLSGTLSAATGNITTINSSNIYSQNASISGRLRATEYDLQVAQNTGGALTVAPTLRIDDSMTATTLTRDSSNNITLRVTHSSITKTDIGGITWATGCKVKVSLDVNGKPSGTMDGTITALNTSSHFIEVKVSGGDAANLDVTNKSISHLAIMVYELANGNPVGIQINCYDTRNEAPAIRIYGGTSTTPTAMLGKLDSSASGGAGLPKVNSEYPSGWGMYTSNGYFTGVIVSESGKIGGWTLGTNAIYSGTNSMTSTNAGTYIGAGSTATSGIRNYASATQYVNISQGKITALGVDLTGKITANSGYIGGSSGWTIESQQISSGSIGADNSMYLSTKNLAGTIAGTTLTTTAPSWRFTVGSNFGVTNTGVLYANSTQISGNLTATDGFTVVQNNKTLTSITTNGMIVYDGNGSNDSNIVAKFTSNGAQIGKNVNTFTEISPSAIVFKNGTATLLTIDQNSFNATVGGKSEAFEVSFAENKPEKISYSFNCDNNDPLSIELDIPTDRVFSISINFKIDGYSDSNVFNLTRSDFQLIPPSSTSESYTPGGIYPNSWAVSYESRRGWNGEQLPSCEVSATYEYNFNTHILTITPSSTNVTISDYDVVISWQEGANNNYDEVYLVLGNRSSVGSNGLFSSSFGQNLTASGNYSLAQGDSCAANGIASHADGKATMAYGDYSHAEGYNTIASGTASHAEGSGATASGSASHAEGSATASGSTSHAEGSGATASGSASHAEGFGTTASGAVSHAEGDVTTASGSASHAQNTQTIASKNSQTTIGTFNIEDTSTTTTHPSGVASYGQYSFIIGNGTSSARSNALTVDWSGNVDAAGTLRAKTEQIAPTISRITGTTVRYRIRRFGNVVTIYLTVRNPDSVAVGGFIYQAKFGGIPLPPDWVSTATYFGGRAIAATLSSDGVVYVRNTSSAAFAVSSAESISFSFTYVIN